MPVIKSLFSGTFDFKYAILTNLSIPENPPGNPLVPSPTPNGFSLSSPHEVSLGCIGLICIY